ncbi:MAG: DUF1573 domain-containing protein, partial [Myxococcota bacterium]|nr:DUF1573 domain-containing protein [Myxococcota bacterium]
MTTDTKSRIVNAHDGAQRSGRRRAARLSSRVLVVLLMSSMLVACLDNAATSSDDPGAHAPIVVEVKRAGEDAAERVTEKKPLLNFYRGMEPERISSQSIVESPAHRHHLGTVLQGDIVQHEFLIANPSTETLEILDVEMCTGCILESRPKEIPAGLEGGIVFVMTTDRLGGETLEGTITATTNSPTLPTIKIAVSLDVTEFAALSPYRVWLKGRVGQ